MFRHRASDHLERIVTPDFITDFLSFGQLFPPPGVVLNVFAPGCIGNSLDFAGRGVSVALTDKLEHAAEPRLGEPQWPTGLFFTADLDYLKLPDPGLL